MHKFCFSIRTRDGLPIARLTIPGQDRAEAERKLKQMYRHCEILACESDHRAVTDKVQASGSSQLASLFAKREDISG